MNSKDKNVVTTFFLVTTAEKVMNIMVKHWIIYGIAKTENKSALTNILVETIKIPADSIFEYYPVNKCM